MGSEDGDDDEQPVHWVSLSAFYIDVLEVTNALYEKCVQAKVCSAPSDSGSSTRRSYYGEPNYAEYPVIQVNWEQARKLCEWRGARLPTEAEWERAARGGLEGMAYPWGDEAPVCQSGAPNGAKFDDNAGCNETDTEPAGSYSANDYGLYDLAGNVWEWTADWFGLFSDVWEVNPGGPESGEGRLVRGGAWSSDAGNLRVASRNWHDPAASLNYVGFRCARSP
jgi:formylglycine-generating enzyme required for sulfatase activity